ncbi:hypothetical protein FOWG_12963 [Fusarium oxysporum f. sp. lycopersici MN25]|nr:hypothetical protein FOWG_12963 [Fusarium oxysporum f. sp. lycopersici MN25]
MKERMPLPAEISSLCSTLFVAVSTRLPRRRSRSLDATLVLQLAHSSVKEFILSCPRTEFDGLLIQSIARLTITEICLVYFLEMDCSLSDKELLRTHHLLPFALDSWIHDASCRWSRFNTFTHLSMELFSNNSLFKRWRKFIESRIDYQPHWSSRRLLKHDQVFYASLSGDQSCVKRLIDACAAGDTTAWKLDPALRIACELGRLETVALLIKEGADVSPRGLYGNPLENASTSGRLDIMELLIKGGADFDA